MQKNIAIGIQSFEEIIKQNYFYIDKTDFIKEWWESGDAVTLITRPRRFGKTLNMSMLECFFSLNYANRGDLFERLFVWQDEKYRQLQGTYPVINLSFASIKEKNYKETVMRICELLQTEFQKREYLIESDKISESEKIYIKKMISEVSEFDAGTALNKLAYSLSNHYGKKVIILLDEYDTPMQEAYVHGYWDDLVAFTRSMFNSAFKTNPYLYRAVMTGITRISKESVFSDLNNLKVITTTSDEYATAFGFTQEEVFSALDEFGLSDEKEGVKRWYDGFIFGNHSDIYNPWSILNFLDTHGDYASYWANTSSNSLVGKLIREGNKRIKISFEKLLMGEAIQVPIDEQIVFNRIDDNEAAVWSLLLASGYLKAVKKEKLIKAGVKPKYTLTITNNEVYDMFINMVHDWFVNIEVVYGDFITSFLDGDIEAMNEYMNKISRKIFSYFDTGKDAEDSEPERFYHGVVLGLLTELDEEYILRSNRESGLGRYDVMLEPRDKSDESKYAYILEFKVRNRKEKTLEETVENALKQIEEKQYETELTDRGVDADRIRKYGFGFEGKKVLIGE